MSATREFETNSFERDSIEIEKILFEKVKSISQIKTELNMFSDYNIKFYVDRALDTITIQLLTHSVRHIAKKDKIEFEELAPQSRWDNFKLAVFPSWLLRKFPVKKQKRIYDFEIECRIPNFPRECLPQGSHLFVVPVIKSSRIV